MIVRELNPQAVLLEIAQTEIKKTLKDSYFQGLAIQTAWESVSKRIRATQEQLTNKELKRVAPLSLERFARLVWWSLIIAFGADGKRAHTKIQIANNVANGATPTYRTSEFGVATQRYAKEYMREVKSKLDEIAKSVALDTDDVSGKNSLRNKAEMEVRYQSHLDSIEDFKAKGVKLVVCSAHQDCSARCFPWQGRVYSLDGSSGSIDGLPYVPLERATDVFYTTKAGKTYKNGLLGFNCRHRLYEYKAGMKMPRVSRATQMREDAINRKQREYERRIREQRDKALMLKGVSKADYEQARANVTRLYTEYKQFSLKNERAFYPSRVEIL